MPTTTICQTVALVEPATVKLETGAKRITALRNDAHIRILKPSLVSFGNAVNVVINLARGRQLRTHVLGHVAPDFPNPC